MRKVLKKEKDQKQNQAHIKNRIKIIKFDRNVEDLENQINNFLESGCNCNKIIDIIYYLDYNFVIIEYEIL